MIRRPRPRSPPEASGWKPRASLDQDFPDYLPLGTNSRAEILDRVNSGAAPGHHNQSNTTGTGELGFLSLLEDSSNDSFCLSSSHFLQSPSVFTCPEVTNKDSVLIDTSADLSIEQGHLHSQGISYHDNSEEQEE